MAWVDSNISTSALSPEVINLTTKQPGPLLQAMELKISGGFQPFLAENYLCSVRNETLWLKAFVKYLLDFWPLHAEMSKTAAMKSQPAETEDPTQGIQLGCGDTWQTGCCWPFLLLTQPIRVDFSCGTRAGASDTICSFLNPFPGNH